MQVAPQRFCEASQLEAYRAKPGARICIIGLPVCLGLAQPIEIKTGPPFQRRRQGEIENGLGTLFDGAQRFDAGSPDHRCVHVGRRMQAVDGHAAALDFMGEVYREQDLRQLALAVSPLAAVAVRQHDIREVDRLLSRG